ncbi:MAG: FHA domain-containing protein [Deltaproteobacteria bacterium]|nr:FHA domain-containing protein [Deltaproteobacteria bacterium]
MTVQLQLGAAQLTLEGEGSRIFAGRDPSTCKLAHQDATLSRRHAEIWLADGKAYLRDLGSANGSWIDGQHLGHEPVLLQPGMQVYLGHVPLGVTWPVDGSKTAMAQQMPPELLAMIAAHRQSAMAPAAAAPTAAAGASGQISASGSTSTPLPGEMAYRKQGSNDNGVLLLALKQDTHFSGHNIDGYVEFTALDNETVASITVELVEIHRRKSTLGSWEKEHVWDRVLVRQGPWKAQHNDVLPLPFSLRCAPGTSMTNREVSWEIRGQVDINWASDIDAMIPITMRNPDIERLRDAMGAMDYRVEDIGSEPAGQRFEGRFMPPAHMAKEWGVNHVTLEIEYLGANLKVRMKLDKKGLRHDPAVDQVFELGRLRGASQAELDVTVKQMLDQLLK